MPFNPSDPSMTSNAVSGTQGSESSMGLGYQSGLIREAEATLGCSNRRDLIWNLFHK